jgi:hypothetical protein
MKKVVYLITTISLLTAMFVSCNKSIPVTGVELNQNTIRLKPDEVFKLKATIKPFDATNYEVVWTSSNKSVATVSSSGLVTAISSGSTTITVTTEDGNKTDECIVTVDSIGGSGGDGETSDLNKTQWRGDYSPDMKMTITFEGRDVRVTVEDPPVYPVGYGKYTLQGSNLTITISWQGPQGEQIPFATGTLLRNQDGYIHSIQLTVNGWTSYFIRI